MCLSDHWSIHLTSEKGPHFLLTVVSEATLFCQNENQWAHAALQINFFHLDYSAFTCLIVYKQTSHSSEYLAIYLQIRRQMSMLFLKKNLNLLHTFWKDKTAGNIECFLLRFQNFKMLLRYESELKIWELEEKRVIARQNTSKLPTLPLHNICVSCIGTNHFDRLS